MREWGRKKFPDRKISDRGKVPKDIVDAFKAEHDITPKFSAASA
jgi:hypothetical protein